MVNFTQQKSKNYVCQKKRKRKHHCLRRKCNLKLQLVPEWWPESGILTLEKLTQENDPPETNNKSPPDLLVYLQYRTANKNFQMLLARLGQYNPLWELTHLVGSYNCKHLLQIGSISCLRIFPSESKVHVDQRMNGCPYQNY